MDSASQINMWIEFLGHLLNFNNLFFWISSFPLSSKAYSSLWLSLWAWKNYSIQRQKESCKIFEMILLSLLSVNLQHIQHTNRPFYSCVLGCLAFEWKWGRRWPCFDRNFTAFLMLIAPNWHKNNIINIRREGRFLSKQGHLLPRFLSMDRQLF